VRQRRLLSVRYFIAIALLYTAIGTAQATGLPLEVVMRVPLPGGATRFDYQSLDTQRHRLFISHMGSNQVIVFDTQARKVLANLDGFPSATGVTAVPELGRVYVSVPGALLERAAGDGEIAVIDAETLKTIKHIRVGRFPDGSSFVPSLNRLYVSNEMGGTLSVIDTHDERVTDTIQLGGEAGMNAYDPIEERIWANVQTDNTLVAIDPKIDRIVTRIKLPASCEHNHGLLIDAPDRLAFITCDDNAKLLVFDLHTLRVTGEHSVGRDPDVLAYDSKAQLLYVASESGVITLFHLQQGQLSQLGEDRLGDNAHTVSVDPDSGLAYFPLKNDHGKPALLVTHPDILTSSP